MKGHCLSLSSNSQEIGVVGIKNVLILNINLLQLVTTDTVYSSKFHWSPDGKKLLYYNKASILLDLSANQFYKVSKAFIDCVKFSPDSQRIIYQAELGQLFSFAFAEGYLQSKELTKIKNIKFSGGLLTWSPDLRWVILVDYHRNISLYELLEDKLIKSKLLCEDNDNGEIIISWSPDSQKIAYVVKPKYISCYTSIPNYKSYKEIKISHINNELIQSLKENCDYITAISWSPNGKWLGTTVYKKETSYVHIWDL